MTAKIVAVARSARHAFSKPPELAIRLVAGLGIEGDAHAGVYTQHRSQVAKDPGRRNLRQVHVIHAELHDELNARGFRVTPGDMGENVTTRGIDLLNLPTGTRLTLGEAAVIELTGLRTPCRQLDKFQDGLMAATLAKAPNGTLIRKSGVMAVVLTGGDVHPGDAIAVELPDGPHRPLEPVKSLKWKFVYLNI